MSLPPSESSVASSPPTLLGRWSERVAHDPGAIALIEAATSQAFSRKALDDLGSRWAQNVSSYSRLRGARIGFALPNGADWVATFLGILRLGGVPVPIDGSEPPARISELARDAGSSFLWSNGRLSPLLPPSSRRAAANAGLCVIKLTSGSTGRPRALAFSDQQMLADGSQICSTMGISGDDLNLALVPFGHSYGLGNLLMPLLAQGTASLCVSAPLPQAIAQDCERWRPTIFPAVPPLLRVLAMADLPDHALASLRVIISAGAPLPVEVADAFFTKFQKKVHSFYGSTETGGIAYDRSGEATRTGRSVGLPLDGVSVSVKSGQRIEIASAAVFTRGNRRQTAAGLGCYQPADRAEMTAEGEIRLLGRTGRMVKIAGRRVDLTELEATVRKLPGIQEAFFTAHPEQPDELAGAVMSEKSTDDVRAVLREHLAPWKVPRRLVVLVRFPLTSRGKTDTTALRATLAARQTKS